MKSEINHCQSVAKSGYIRIRSSGAFALLLILAIFNSALPSPECVAGENAMRVYIGTYTGKKSRGIYVSRLDMKTGELSAPELAAESKNPSFLAVHPKGRFVYAAGE